MIHKNAYLRYIILDRCFQNTNKKYFIDDLLKEITKYFLENDIDFSIQKRQLYEDIKFMKSSVGWSIPLKKTKIGRRIYYTYAIKKFSINNIQISENELDTISNAIKVLSKYKTLPQINWLKDLMTSTSFSKQNEVISFEYNTNIIRIELLSKLYHHIVNNENLEIKYKTCFSDEYTYNVLPCFIKQYKQKWFLIAYNQKDKYLQTLSIEDLKGMKVVKNNKNKELKICFKSYFKNIIGVSKDINSKPLKIHLLIDKTLKNDLLKNPIHSTQKTIRTGSVGITIELEIVPNFELQELLAIYGNKIKVLSPINYLHKKYTTIHKKYNYYNMKYINNKNVKLYFIEKQNNESKHWILFVPGAVNSAEQIHEDLKEAPFNYFVLSLRGRGRSDSPINNYTLEDQASDITCFINQLDKNIALNVFAHSVGVPISIIALNNTKRKINTFIMCEFAPFYPPFDKNWSDNIRKQKIDSISKIAIEGIVKDAKYIDVSKELKLLQTKIVLFVGNNQFSALRTKEKNALQKLVPTIEIIEIKGGHDLLNENTKQTIKHIDSYSSLKSS